MYENDNIFRQNYRLLSFELCRCENKDLYFCGFNEDTANNLSVGRLFFKEKIELKLPLLKIANFL